MNKFLRVDKSATNKNRNIGNLEEVNGFKAKSELWAITKLREKHLEFSGKQTDAWD